MERRGWGVILVCFGVFVYVLSRSAVVMIPRVCMLKGGLAPHRDDYRPSTLSTLNIAHPHVCASSFLRAPPLPISLNNQQIPLPHHLACDGRQAAWCRQGSQSWHAFGFCVGRAVPLLAVWKATKLLCTTVRPAGWLSRESVCTSCCPRLISCHSRAFQCPRIV